MTLREVREGMDKTLGESLAMEFRMVHQCIYGKSDFVEGIRALLIDKTGDPKWDPPSIEQARSVWAVETGNLMPHWKVGKILPVCCSHCEDVHMHAGVS